MLRLEGPLAHAVIGAGPLGYGNPEFELCPSKLAALPTRFRKGRSQLGEGVYGRRALEVHRGTADTRMRAAEILTLSVSHPECTG